MHSAIFCGNIWPGKNVGPTLLRGQLSSLKRQLSAAVWVRALGRTFQSWRVCETWLKNCLWLLLYLSFISPLRTVRAMSVNTNRILDSWRLENSTWSRSYTKICLHFLRQSSRMLIIVEEYQSFASSSSDLKACITFSWKISKRIDKYKKTFSRSMFSKLRSVMAVVALSQN